MKKLKAILKEMQWMPWEELLLFLVAACVGVMCVWLVFFLFAKWIFI